MEKPRNDSAVKEDTETMIESEKAITGLNDAIMSSHEDSKLIIANLKKIVQGDEKREALLKNNFYQLELRDDGLTDSEIRNLSRVLSVQENYVTFENNYHLILVAFSIIESGEHGFRRLFDIYHVDNIRQIGIMVCEILFHSKVSELAKEFLSLKSFVQIQTQVLKILKNNLLNPPTRALLNVIHTIASCGNRMKDAIPDEIGELHFTQQFDVTDMSTLVAVMSHCTHVRRLLFDSCGITSSCIQTFLTQLEKSELKISAIYFSWNNDMGVDGLEHVGAIVKQHQVDMLSLRSCGLNADEVESFNKGAGDAKISEINFSWNRNMGEAGLEHIGAVAEQHRVNKLNLSWCDLNAEEVQSFNKGAGDAKISEINFSRNTNMGEAGLEHVGAIAKQHKVDKLHLGECGLGKEKVQAFIKEAGNAKISEIDFSSNYDMGVEGLAHVGAIAKQHKVDKLNLSRCSLNAEKVKSFNKGAGDAKISEIDFSGNAEMGEVGLAHVGAVVKQHEVHKLGLSSTGLTEKKVKSFTKAADDGKLIELDISINDMAVPTAGYFGAFVSNNGVEILNMNRCKLGFDHMYSFIKNLGDAKMRRLDISHQESFENKPIVRLFFSLLPRVTEHLDLRGMGLNEHDISLIQDFLDYTHPSNLKVQVDEGTTLFSAPRDQADLLQTLRQKFLDALNAQRDNSQGSKFCNIARLIHSCEDLAQEVVPAEIQSIDLNKNTVLESDARALAMVTSHCFFVQKLDLSHCDLTSKGAVALHDGLKESRLKIAEFDASNNPNITWKGVGAIGAIASEHATDKLQLAFCKLKFNDVIKLCKDLENSQLSKLDISGNEDIGVEGSSAVGKLVAKTGIKTLNMSSCGMELDHFQAFAEKLEDAKLSELDISGNEDIGVEGSSAIGKLVAKTGIKTLNMSSCGMELDHFQAFAEKLEDAKMTHLDISHQQSYPLTAILALLPHVTERLISGTVSDFCIEYLQHYLNYYHPTTLKIVIGNVRELQSEPSDLNNFHQSLRQRFLTSQSRGLINTIHFIHTCEGLAKEIVPEEISSMHLSGAKLSEFDVRVLVKVTSHCTIIRKLSLSNCNITAFVFCELISMKPKVLELDMFGNEDIGVKGCEAVGQVVAKSEIEKLNMSSCGMELDHFVALADKLEDAKMTHLEISHVRSYPLKAMLALLPHVTQRLHLIGNRTSVPGINYLQDYLNYYHPLMLKITILNVMELQSEPSDLSTFHQSLRQRFLTSRGLELTNIIHFIHSCEGLAKKIVQEEIFSIHLDRTKLSKFDAQVLIKVTSHSTVIRKLSLSDCNITACFVNELMSLKPKVIELDISYNYEMGTKGVECVGKIVRSNFVEKLDIRSCGLENKQIEVFHEVTKKIKIIHLDLSHQMELSSSIRSQNCFPLSAVCNLLPMVTGCIDLSDNYLTLDSQSFLQNQLNSLDPTDLRIVIAKDNVLTRGNVVRKDLPSHHDEPMEKYRNLGDDNVSDDAALKKTTALWIKSEKEEKKRKQEFTSDKKVSMTRALEGSSFHYAPPPEKKAKLIPKEILSETDDESFSSEKEISDADSDISKIQLSPYESPLAKQLKMTHQDQSILSKTTTEEVGQKGATITVCECSVAFPEGCFYDTETVTISVLLDSSAIPSNKESVTPILSVRAANMRKPAIVTLSTWCVDEEEQGIGVNVIRYSSSKMEWMDLCHCMLGKSGLMQFECDHFCKIVGVTEKDAPLTYFLKPVICTVDRVLSVALMKDMYLQMNLFLKAVEQDNRYSKFSNLHHTFNNVTCRRPDAIQINPEIEDDNSTVKFKPEELTFDIEDVAGDDDPSYNSFSIKGTVRTSPVEVTFFIKKNNVRKQRRVVSLDMEIDPETASSAGSCIEPTANDEASTSSRVEQTSKGFSNHTMQNPMMASAKKDIVVKSETPDEISFPKEAIQLPAASALSTTHIHINAPSTFNVDSSDRRQITGLNVATEGSIMQKQDENCTETLSVTPDSGVKPEKK